MTDDKKIIIPTPEQVESLCGGNTESSGKGWMMCEYSGHEILKVPDDIQGKAYDNLTPEDFEHLRQMATDAEVQRQHFVTNPAGLRVGDNILCFMALEHWYWATVSELDEDGGLAMSPDAGLAFELEFSDDDRHCWVTPGAMNLEALEKCR